MLVMEVQEWDWVNYLTWEDGLQLRVEYWKLSYTPSRTQSPSFKKKGLDLSGGGLQHKFAFGRNLEIAIQYFSEPLSLMKA